MQPPDLLNVAVIVDMILTIAVVTVAPGTVTELQLGIRNIRSAADGTPVGIGCLGGCNRCLVRAGLGEGDDLGLLRAGFGLPFPENPPHVQPPGNGDHI